MPAHSPGHRWCRVVPLRRPTVVTALALPRRRNPRDAAPGAALGAAGTGATAGPTPEERAWLAVGAAPAWSPSGVGVVDGGGPRGSPAPEARVRGGGAGVTSQGPHPPAVSADSAPFLSALSAAGPATASSGQRGRDAPGVGVGLTTLAAAVCLTDCQGRESCRGRSFATADAGAVAGEQGLGPVHARPPRGPWRDSGVCGGRLGAGDERLESRGKRQPRRGPGPRRRLDYTRATRGGRAVPARGAWRDRRPGLQHARPAPAGAGRWGRADRGRCRPARARGPARRALGPPRARWARRGRGARWAAEGRRAQARREVRPGHGAVPAAAAAPAARAPRRGPGAAGPVLEAVVPTHAGGRAPGSLIRPTSPPRA